MGFKKGHWLVVTMACGCRAEPVEPPLAASRFAGPPLAETTHTVLQDFHAACHSSEIVPEVPVPLAGFGGIHRRLVPPLMSNVGHGPVFQAPFESVGVPPRVKVCVFRGGEAPAAILVSLDLVATTSDLTSLVGFRARQALGLSSRSPVIVSATHTHSGPAGLWEDSVFSTFAGDELIPWYRAEVLDAVAETARLAQASLDSVPTASTGLRLSSSPGLVRSRIAGMDSEGTQLRVVFGAGGTNPSGCLGVLAAHSTLVGQSELSLSADLAGHVEQALQSDSKAGTCLFLPGALGNADAALENGEKADEYASRVADTMNDQATLVVEKTISSLQAGTLMAELPSPRINERGCELPHANALVSAPLVTGRARRIQLGYMSFQDVLLVFLPGEPVETIAREIAQAVKSAFPALAHVQIISVANDYIGYLVDERTYGQATLESCSSLYPPETSLFFIRAIIGHLQKVTHATNEFANPFVGPHLQLGLPPDEAADFGL